MFIFNSTEYNKDTRNRKSLLKLIPATTTANELLSNTVLPPSVNRNTTFVEPTTLGLAIVTVRLPADPSPLSIDKSVVASTDSVELDNTESVNGVLDPLTVTLNVNKLLRGTRCSAIEEMLGETTRVTVINQNKHTNKSTQSIQAL